MKSFLSSIFILICTLCACHGDCQCLGDISPPICSAQDITVYLDNVGNASISALDIDNGGFDDCSDPLILVIDSSSFDRTELGANPVTLNVTDSSSNSSTCTATVTVMDTVAPVCISGDALVDLYIDITVTLTAFFVDVGSSDNCDIDQFVISPNQFSCEDVGDNPITFMTFDESVNSLTMPCSTWNFVLCCGNGDRKYNA